jgi:Resolvase, N terminal domain.
MIFGYIYPTPKHSVSDQSDLLKQAGARELVIEQTKGDKIKAYELITLLERMKEGDTLKVLTIYVFPLTTLEVIQVIDGLLERKIEFESITEHIADKELFTILANHLRFTRRVRSQYGIEMATARGRKGGRKKGLSEEAQKTAWSAAELHKGKIPIETIMSQLGIGSKATLYKYLRFAGIINKKSSK